MCACVAEGFPSNKFLAVIALARKLHGSNRIPRRRRYHGSVLKAGSGLDGCTLGQLVVTHLNRSVVELHIKAGLGNLVLHLNFGVRIGGEGVDAFPIRGKHLGATGNGCLLVDGGTVATLNRNGLHLELNSSAIIGRQGAFYGFTINVCYPAFSKVRAEIGVPRLLEGKGANFNPVIFRKTPSASTSLLTILDLVRMTRFRDKRLNAVLINFCIVKLEVNFARRTKLSLKKSENVIYRILIIFWIVLFDYILSISRNGYAVVGGLESVLRTVRGVVGAVLGLLRGGHGIARGLFLLFLGYTASGGLLFLLGFRAAGGRSARGAVFALAGRGRGTTSLIVIIAIGITLLSSRIRLLLTLRTALLLLTHRCVCAYGDEPRNQRNGEQNRQQAFRHWLAFGLFHDTPLSLCFANKTLNV